MAEQKPRVLMVDDEPAILKIMGKLLQLSGFELSTAMDGEEGLAKVKSEHPAVVILDLMLPKLTGFQVCEAIKQDAACRDIPVVIFTARGQPGDEERCRKLGANAYFPKTHPPDDFIKTIQQLAGAK